MSTVESVGTVGGERASIKELARRAAPRGFLYWSIVVLFGVVAGFMGGVSVNVVQTYSLKTELAATKAELELRTSDLAASVKRVQEITTDYGVAAADNVSLTTQNEMLRATANGLQEKVKALTEANSSLVSGKCSVWNKLGWK